MPGGGGCNAGFGGCPSAGCPRHQPPPNRRRGARRLRGRRQFPGAWPPPAAAESPIQLNGEGRITLGGNRSALGVQSGTATHLGTYVSYEEVVFVPGDEDGDLHGAGLIAFVAANGDMLVGVTTWQVHADGTTLQSVKWRDTVTFADGTTAASTGRFAET